jgi:hypothetical protein
VRFLWWTNLPHLAISPAENKRFLSGRQVQPGKKQPAWQARGWRCLKIATKTGKIQVEEKSIAANGGKML